MDATQRQREFEAARSASRRRMIILAQVWGPVFIVVGAKAVLQERQGARRRSAANGTGVSPLPLIMTGGLMVVFAAAFSIWLAIGLPSDGVVRIPLERPPVGVELGYRMQGLRGRVSYRWVCQGRRIRLRMVMAAVPRVEDRIAAALRGPGRSASTRR